jgi:hypothetical protein
MALRALSQSDAGGMAVYCCGVTTRKQVTLDMEGIT